MIDEKLNRLMDLEAADPRWATTDWLQSVVRSKQKADSDPANPFWIRRMLICLSEYQNSLFANRKACKEQVRLSQDLFDLLAAMLPPETENERFFQALGI